MSRRINEEEQEIAFLKNNPFNKKIILPTLINISFSKIISSYGVIALHVNDFWSFQSKDYKHFKKINFLETLFYYSVPVFALCIGATLLNFNERYSLYDYNKKRFLKVFVPLLGWNVIFYFYKSFFLRSINLGKLNFSNIWNYFFLSKIVNIYDSLHLFLLTYMLVPLLAYIDKEKKMKIYIIYIFAGYILHNYNFLLFQKFVIYLLGAISFFIHLFGTEISFYRNRANIRLHKGYLNLPSILYSCAIFLLIKENSFLLIKYMNKNFINKIGSLTLGPFFLHRPFLETIRLFPKLYNNLIFSSLLFSLIIFCVCLLLTYILKKIPILKYLVP